jgi:hypothetical protein
MQYRRHSVGTDCQTGAGQGGWSDCQTRLESSSVKTTIHLMRSGGHRGMMNLSSQNAHPKTEFLGIPIPLINSNG